MAEEKDILGIGAHLDIGDIQRSINELINGLDKIGVKTDVLSKRMNDAMNDIARSTDDSATKQKRAMDVLSQGLSEVKNALANYPEQLRQAKNEADQTAQATARLETELNKLNGQFMNSTVGTKAYDELGRSIDGVKQQIQSNNQLHEQQLHTIQQMEAGYNGLVSMLGLANTGTAANAVLHGTVAAATATEAAAHADNTGKIEKETQATLENKNAKESQSETEQKVAQAVEEEVKAYDRLFDKINEGKATSEEYARNLDTIKARIAALREEADKVGNAQAIEIDKLNTSDMVDGKLVSRGSEEVVNSLTQEYSKLTSQISALETTLNELEQAWARTHRSAASSQEQVTQKVNETKQAEQELNAEVNKEPAGFKSQWNTVNELHSKIQELTKELRTYEDEYDMMAEKPGFDDKSKKAKELQENIANLRKEIESTKQEYNDLSAGAGTSLAKWTNAISDFMTGHGKFQASLGDMKTALGGMIAPFTSATSGAVAFTRALWSMAATPIGAVLSAIVLALKAVHSWFTKSADGQRAFAAISAYVGSLLSSITDIAVKVGRYLYHAFADPQGSLNQFGKGLVGMVINPLKAIAKTLSGVGKIAKGVIDLIASGANVAEAKKAVAEMSKGWDDLKSAASSVGDTIASVWNAGVGLVKGTGKLVAKGLTTAWESDLSELGSDMFGKAAKAAALAKSEIDVQQRLGEERVKSQKLDVEIAKEREKIYMLTGKEKDAQIEIVKALLKQKYDGQITQQQKLLDIHRERMKLHENTLENYAKERELQGSVYSLEAQRAASTRMLIRMQQSNLKAMANAGKKDARQQQQITEADARYEETVRKNIVSREKAEREMESRLTDARIDAMKEGAEKVLAEKERAFKKELEQLDEQRRAAIEAERNRQKSEHDAREKVIKARGGKTQEWDESMLDTAAIDRINEKYDELARIAADKRRQEEARTQLEAMRDYLKEYGTFQQRKLAIAQEYAEKIRNAEALGNKGLVLKLEAQRDRDLGEEKANELAKGIDFTLITRGMSQMMDSIMEETLERVRQYKLTDEYKKSTPESKKAISDLEMKLLEKGFGGSVSPFGSWNEINKHAKEFDEAVKQVTLATKNHEEAVQEWEEAKSILEESMKNGASDFFIDMKKKVLEEAEKKMAQTGEELTDAQGKQKTTGQQVKEDFQRVDQGLQEFSTMISQITSGSLSGFANGVSNLIAMFTKSDKDNGKGLVGLIGEKAGGIIGAIIQIIDALGDKPVEFIDSLFEKITKAVENILAQLPELIMSIIEGIGNLVTGIVSGLGNMFGFNDLFGISGNSARVAKTTERLTRQNELLSDRISTLTEAIEKESGKRAIISYKAALDAQKELQSNNMEILQAQMSEWGKHHSNNYYSDDSAIQNFYNMSKSAILKGFGELKDSKGNTVTINGLDDIYTLSPESMMAIKTYAPALWSYLTTVGEYDKSEYWENVVEQAGKIEELTEQIRENLTQTTSENIFDDLMDGLIDLADGAEDVFDDIAGYWQKMVNRMVLMNVLGDSLRSEVEEWYKSVADLQNAYYGESQSELIAQRTELERQLEEVKKEHKDRQEKEPASYLISGDYFNNLSVMINLQNEIDKLNKEISKGNVSEQEYEERMEQYAEELKKIYSDYTDKTQELIDKGLLKPVSDEANRDQTTTMSMAEKATYDQFETWLGIAVAQQIALEQIKDRVYSMTGDDFADAMTRFTEQMSLQYPLMEQQTENQVLMLQNLDSMYGMLNGINGGIASTIELHEAANGKLDRIIRNTEPIAEIRDFVKRIVAEV